MQVLSKSLVFLRVLDYYTGILFLTTNRSGALDEAFKSRIHYKILYTPLTRDQTLEIWKLNIQRMRQICEHSKEKRPLKIIDSEILEFAESQYDYSGEKRAGRWNGRQIRNAFQVARSLAYYDALVDPDQDTEISPHDAVTPAILDIKYFQMMHEITESFDHYMLEVFNGMDDGELALEMEHRADHYIQDRYSRSIPARHEYDDRPHGSNGVMSPFNVGSWQDQGDRRKSLGNKGRPSIGGTGMLQL
jgi:hypothetical protein